MKLLASIGHFMLGLGALIYAIKSCIIAWFSVHKTNEIGYGRPAGTYEDDTKWDFDEY